MFSGWAKRSIERDPRFAVIYYGKEARRAERKYGMNAPQTLILRQQYAVALHRSGKSEKAEAELAAACDRLLGADHPDAIDAHENHAVTLARLDRVAEAEAEMAGVAESLTAANGSDDATTLGGPHVAGCLPGYPGSPGGERGRMARTGRSEGPGARERSCRHYRRA